MYQHKSEVKEQGFHLCMQNVQYAMLLFYCHVHTQTNVSFLNYKYQFY